MLHLWGAESLSVDVVISVFKVLDTFYFYAFAQTAKYFGFREFKISSMQESVLTTSL